MSLSVRQGRRCATCGSAISGPRCGECGSSVPPRAEIGILAGVNNNFGTVNNVYNIASPAPEPELVDLRDVQDGLNARFPERIPGPPPVPYFPSSVAPKRLPGTATRAANKVAYVVLAVCVVFAIALAAALLWA